MNGTERAGGPSGDAPADGVDAGDGSGSADAPADGAGAARDAAEPSLTSRSIRTFVIRNGRLTGAQGEALERLLPRWGIDHDAVRRASPEGGVAALFPHPDRPLRVEVGFGNGDALLAMAEAEPGVNFLGIEVHAPGVGHALLGLEARERAGAPLGNVRVCRHDAIEVLERLCAPGSVDRVHVFFPDPWVKKRHHKRRILQGDFLDAAARALAPGGLLHAATDVVEYADWMLEKTGADARFRNVSPDGRFVARPHWRPSTRFERRGERLGHEVRDLLLERGRTDPA